MGKSNSISGLFYHGSGDVKRGCMSGLGSLMADGSGCAYDKGSMAAIRLNNTTVLYLKEVTKFLALVCILREESFEKKGLCLSLFPSLCCCNTYI